MPFARLTPLVSVAPQIVEADLEVIAARGFKSVVNNRPDGEAVGQPTSAALATAAGRAGLAYRHVPVVSGQLTEQDVDDFARTLASLEGPVLAFCRSGTRSTALWALAEARRLGVDAVLETAASAGYDLATLRPLLAHRARSQARPSA